MRSHIASAVLDRLFGPAEEINGARCPTYMYRWQVAQLGAVKVYVHRFVGDDWSLDLHDHPKRFVSIGLRGRYNEESGEGRLSLNSALSTYRHYRAPWLRTFAAKHCHRIFLTPGEECWTLVFVGPPQRDWGFWHRGPRPTARQWACS